MKLPDRYKPTGETFTGGQGVVSIWTDSSLGRKVAVKILSTRGIGGSLLHEAALLAAIHSKHVVELFEIGVDGTTGKEYLIMEFVDGTELHGYTPTDLQSLYLTLYQIASGLVDIHAATCLHRDLKPDNLKRDAAGIIKIIDFGIGTSQIPAHTNLGRGTDGYRGPEYYSNPIQLTRAVDVYAFAVIAHEFCFGALDATLFNLPPARPPSFSTASIGPSARKLDLEVVTTLDASFEPDPIDRPTAARLKEVLAKHLLRSRHVATFVHDGSIYVVSTSSKQFSITGQKGTFQVSYDGLDFILTQVTGQIFVNGVTASVGMKIPGSCVIIIGAGSGADRDFIPFNVSHPEVVL